MSCTSVDDDISCSVTVDLPYETFVSGVFATARVQESQKLYGGDVYSVAYQQIDPNDALKGGSQ